MPALTIDDLIAGADPAELAAAARRRVEAIEAASAEDRRRREQRTYVRSLAHELNELGRPRVVRDPYRGHVPHPVLLPEASARWVAGG